MRVGTTPLATAARLLLLRRGGGRCGGLSGGSSRGLASALTPAPPPPAPPPRFASSAACSTSGGGAACTVTTSQRRPGRSMSAAAGRGEGVGCGGSPTTAAAPLCAPTTEGGDASPPPGPLLAPEDAYAGVVAALGPMSEEPMIPPAPPLVLVISGPSGVGKDAALAALIAARPPGSLRTVVTATTRPPRPGERDGVDYRFVSHSTFQAWLEEGSLLEHALVYGEYKGVPRAALEEVLATGADVALRVDVQGAAALRALLPGAVRIFLAAESEASLVRRLTSRKTEPLGALERRVGTARREVAAAREFDYVVVNREGDLAGTVASLSAIIDAEKCRAGRLVVEG